jgi:hypothetical protein
MNNLAIFNFLPFDIIKLIQFHLQALIIQNTFKLNRPLTDFEIGDRVIFNKVYGTIIKVYDTICKIKLLPRLIPNWKNCNVNFWKHFEYNSFNNFNNLLEAYKFPYYTPKTVNVNKNSIIKLNSWNDKSIEDINIIDSTKRIDMYMNYNKNIILNFKILESGNTTKSNMFGYFI